MLLSFLFKIFEHYLTGGTAEKRDGIEILEPGN